MRKTRRTVPGNREKSVLDIYFTELRRIPLLSREQEKTCAARARDGDREAKDVLIRSNLRFVVQVAKKYKNCGLPLSDLISEGTIGLMNAVDRYDVDRGYHFISYAVWWIHQAILKAISQKAPLIRLPINKAAEVSRIKKMIDAREEQSGKHNVLRGVAKAAGKDMRSMEQLLSISQHHLSLDKEVNHEEDPSPLKELVADPAGKDPQAEVVERALSEEISRVLDTLSEREAEVIKDRYGLEDRLPLSLKQIGERYKLSKERVRQLQIRALTKLKEPSRNARLRNYAR
ncbi:MAG: RNA polymerase sigma factor RpoD/SigA [Spirochaetales bacterium]|nr:RNA polymerase sigma factor RpoD/SigA [Spirochaetales bacterium]